MALFCTGTICTYQFTLFCTGSITSSNLGWHAATSSKHPSQPLQWTHVGNLGKFWEIASYLVDPGTPTLGGEGDPDFHGFMGDKTGSGRKPGTQMFTRVTSMEPEQLWEILPCTSFTHTNIQNAQI